MAVSGTHVSPRKKQVIQIHSSRLFKHILTGYHLQYELISLFKIHHTTNNSRIFHHAWSVSTIKSKETSSLRPVQQEKKTQDKYHQKRQLNTCISSIWGTYISIDCRDRVLPLISVLLQLGNPSPYRQETGNKIQISPTNGVAIQNASQYTLSLTANCSTHQPPPSTSDVPDGDYSGGNNHTGKPRLCTGAQMRRGNGSTMSLVLPSLMLYTNASWGL